ncbi:MAG: co-chaperone GroES [Firmicutes bacterium]|nr:co-chaperone GroES [Bacillota bacterium]
MKLRPLGDRVVLKRDDAEEKTASGLFIAGTAKEQPQYGVVIAVGPGALVDGQRLPMDVKEGDKVFFSRFGGSEIKLDGQDYIVLGQSDILAVIE